MSVHALVAAAEAAQPSRDELLALLESSVTPVTPWTPAGDRDVEWALECIAESEAESASIDQQLADLVERATARANALKVKAERRADFFRGRVTDYAEANKAGLLTGKKRSREYLSGKIGWRKRGGKLVVADRQALADWLMTQDPALYRMRLEPEMKALQELARTQGVIPPGCDWEPERDELHVEASPLPTITATPTTKELP